MKEIKVFVSSTFKDLHEYRSYLVDHIYPKIEKLCWQKDIHFSYVDFRWGIPHTNINDIVSMCLSQIKKCKPYFIGIIGDRYGTPYTDDINFLGNDFSELVKISKEQKVISITEMEFFEGLFKSDKPNENAFCYKIADGYRMSTGQDFNDIKNNKYRNLFINKILENGYLFKEFDTPEKLGLLILEDFKKHLDTFPDINKKSEISEHKKKQKEIIYSKIRCYIPNQELEALLDNYLKFNYLNNQKPLFIYGPSGCGKSSLIAWYTKLLEEQEDILLITHFVGLDGSSSEKNIVEALLNEIVIHDKNIQSWVDCFYEFKTWISNTKKRVLFLIDGLNNAIQDEFELKLDWIPYNLPENIRFVFTCTDEDSIVTLANELSWNLKEIVMFNKENSINLVKRYLKSIYNKELRENEYEIFIQDNRFNNYQSPLFLTTVMEEIVKIVSFIDVEKGIVNLKKELVDIIRVKNNMSDIIRYYMGLANQEILFNTVLLRLENFFKNRKDIIITILAALKASKSGLTIEQILVVVSLQQYSFQGESDNSNLPNFIETVLEDLDYYIIKRGKKYTLFHNSFLVAVSKKYNIEIKTIRISLIDYYLNSVKKNYNELFYQLYILKKWDIMYNLISNYSNFKEFNNEVNKNDQIKYFEGIHIFYNITKVLLNYLKEFQCLNSLRLLFELYEGKVTSKMLNFIIKNIDKLEMTQNDFKYIYDIAIIKSLKINTNQRFLFLSEFLRISINKFGNNNKLLYEFCKYYADICLEIINKRALMKYGSQFHKINILKNFLVFFLPSKLSDKYYNKLLYQPRIFKNKYALKCRKYFSSEFQRSFDGDASDAELLYQHICNNLDNANNEIIVKSDLNLTKMYLILNLDNIYTIDRLKYGISLCKKSKPFFDLDMGEFYLRIGQYYLNNSDEQKIEEIDNGIENLYKAIIIFNRIKGIFCEEIRECLECIFSTYYAWEKSNRKASDHNIEYIYRFYAYLCEYLSIKKKKFIIMRLTFTLKENIELYKGIKDIAIFFERFDFIPTRDYYTKRKNRNFLQISYIFFKYTAKLLFVFFFFLAYKSTLIEYDSDNTYFYFVRNVSYDASLWENAQSPKRTVYINFKSSKKETTNLGNEIIAEIINKLTRGNLLYAGWDAENCFYSYYNEGKYLYKYNRFTYKKSVLYQGKVKSLSYINKRYIYFLDENRYLCRLNGDKLNTIINIPVYKYLVAENNVYFIPYEKVAANSAKGETLNITDGIDYIDNHTPSMIKKCNLNGSRITTVLKEKISAFTIYKNNLYYITQEGSIKKKDLNTKKEEILVARGVYPKGLHVSQDLIVYFNTYKQVVMFNTKINKKIILHSDYNKLMEIAAFNNVDIKRNGDDIFFFAFNDTNDFIFNTSDSSSDILQQLKDLNSIGLSYGKSSINNVSAISWFDLICKDYNDSSAGENEVRQYSMNEFHVHQFYK